MTPDILKTYIRTEPPALLTKPLTLTLDGAALEAFNDYRQARHAYFATKFGDPDRKRLLKALEDTRGALASYMLGLAQHKLGEPEDWVDAES